MNKSDDTLNFLSLHLSSLLVSDVKGIHACLRIKSNLYFLL